MSATKSFDYQEITSSRRAVRTAYTGRYTQADPLPSLLIADRLSVMLGVRSEVYSYVRENPVRYGDPLGLLPGTSIGPAPSGSPCSYYDNLCKLYGCDYYCNLAPKYCKSMGSILNIFDSMETKLCIQECLIFEDGMIQNNTPVLPNCKKCKTCPGKPNCLSETCITNYHKTCFSKCNSNSFWPGLFPGAGPFFPGGGC
jgi:hypothetical protein